MANKDAFDDRRRTQEESYFRKKEQELIELMRQRAAAQQARDELAEVSGITDVAVLQSLQDLGFVRETVMLLHLAPLVQVAWVDGKVTARERELIFEVAAVRGVAEGSPAHAKLTQWLEQKPAEELYLKAVEVIRILMMGQPDDATAHHDLVEICTRIADASGGIFGFGRRVSDEERAVIERIAGIFAEAMPEATHKVVGEIKHEEE